MQEVELHIMVQADGTGSSLRRVMRKGSWLGALAGLWVALGDFGAMWLWLPLWRDFWNALQHPRTQTWVCGWCDHTVASDVGYMYQQDHGGVSASILICPQCALPTYFQFDTRGIVTKSSPMSSFGESVKNLPAPVEAQYEEARRTYSANCFTACAMLCRGLLMYIAVEAGAKEGESFAFYVEYLIEEGVVGKKGKDWLERVRKVGNQANHKLVPITKEDAETVLRFVAYVLKFNYEFQPTP